MILNMKIDENQENGVLSFKLNDEDYGVAYDKIDITKKYCLAMSLCWENNGWEIVE